MSLALACVILALLAMIQASNAYHASSAMVEQIGQINSTTVDSAEAALEYLASTSQSAADFIALPPDSSLYNLARDTLFADFSRFRDQIFTLRDNVQTEDEREVITNIETAVYNNFWSAIGGLLMAEARGDYAAALDQYLLLDDELTNTIVPLLQQLEDLNYQQMVTTGEDANAMINGQMLALALPAVGLAGGLTYLSFWLRGRIRRYLTPGIDAAMVVAWLLTFLMLTQLAGIPEQFRIMIVDSYRSISASSRVLVDANLANRAESGAILQAENAALWYEHFRESTELIELRICGYVGCVNRSFLAVGATDTVDRQVEHDSRAITPEDSARIGGVILLMGNITFVGEVATIERARLAYMDYLLTNQQLRALIDAGDLEGALEFNTNVEAGRSETAFDQFVAAIRDEREINRAVFDQVYTTQQVEILRNQVLYGVAGLCC